MNSKVRVLLEHILLIGNVQTKSNDNNIVQGRKLWLVQSSAWNQVAADHDDVSD